MTKTTIVPDHCTAVLVLEDGKCFFGHGIGKQGTATGEICFNTGLTGYQETLTDPSYAGQIITFTFPHIGNVGANPEDLEAKKPAALGLIVRENITNPSSFRSKEHFNKWLIENNLVGICGVDTRALTRYIRINGAQNVVVYNFGSNAEQVKVADLQKQAADFPKLKGMELAKAVTCKKAYDWEQSLWRLGIGYSTIKNPKYKVVAVDYGAKDNILRCLASVQCQVIVVPSTASFDEIMKYNPDGVFLSNGPGDPAATGKYAIPVIKQLLDNQVPVFGICLGHQLLALALGGKTDKMHQGHRGCNQPVKNLLTGKVEITSQNHGFVVTQESLAQDVEITHVSLFDDTVEGLRSKTKPAFSVQYHPEASPGPQDSQYLFEQFVELIQQCKKAEKKRVNAKA